MECLSNWHASSPSLQPWTPHSPRSYPLRIQSLTYTPSARGKTRYWTPGIPRSTCKGCQRRPRYRSPTTRAGSPCSRPDLCSSWPFGCASSWSACHWLWPASPHFSQVGRSSRALRRAPHRPSMAANWDINGLASCLGRPRRVASLQSDATLRFAPKHSWPMKKNFNKI